MAIPATASLMSARVGSLPIPPHDNQEFVYIGSTNNISTIKYYRGGLAAAGGVLVATVTFTYVADGAADNDDILTMTLTVPVL